MFKIHLLDKVSGIVFTDLHVMNTILCGCEKLNGNEYFTDVMYEMENEKHFVVFIKTIKRKRVLCNLFLFMNGTFKSY